MAENVVTLTDANFDSEVLKSDVPVMVDFWAEWCGPCKMVAPIIEELAGDYEGKLKVGKLNTDECPQKSAQYGITAIPTIIFFKDGEIADRIVGVKPKAGMVEMIDKVLSD